MFSKITLKISIEIILNFFEVISNLNPLFRKINKIKYKYLIN
jgi:hypothetical protein